MIHVQMCPSIAAIRNAVATAVVTMDEPAPQVFVYQRKSQVADNCIYVFWTAYPNWTLSTVQWLVALMQVY